MGLASKLQAGQGGAPGSMGPPGGAPAPYPAQMGGGAFPSAPPMMEGPPAGSYPGGPGPATPYGQPQPGAAPSPYPPNAFSSSGAAGPAAGPYGGQPPQQQQGFAGQPPAAYPSPYPGANLPPSAGPVGAPGAPGGTPMAGLPGQQQQQQRPPYPPGSGAGAPGMVPPAGGMMQQQQPQAVAGGAPGGMAGAILAKLNAIAAANQLQRFYSPQALQALASRLDSRVNFRDLAARWRMPVELALDLASLALYDIILFADDSGSMAFEENGERIEDLKLIGSKVAEIATLFDDDGILVRFMNSPTEGNAVRSTADVSALLASVQYSGLTPLATALQAKVLQPVVYSLAASGQLAKPVLVMTITDGEPTDNPRDLVVQVIKDARSRLAQYGPKAVAFEFAQVGKDQRAQNFLGMLDKHPEVGKSIDCTSYFEMESAEYQRRGIQLSPEMWLVKMMVGSIDASYDEGDE